MTTTGWFGWWSRRSRHRHREFTRLGVVCGGSPLSFSFHGVPDPVETDVLIPISGDPRTAFYADLSD
ncbi:hypothetical protein GAR05_05058 [Micromonospora saelicesensis]|uniref:Uncharacterized protein n=1 Tax=Micromonospora saelicesensis TaxID=285676 RepID=A0ABX9CE91_9ACTN|nr:hypothetical protein [Micromonospora saelicesensis]RAN94536.1 hypothetical protein GAR05_05058 [Micromonospora saelicesensis]